MGFDVGNLGGPDAGATDEGCEDGVLVRMDGY